MDATKSNVHVMFYSASEIKSGKHNAENQQIIICLRYVLVHLLPKTECLNEEVFDTLAHARRILGRWRHDYNHHRPHSSLGGLTPAARRSLEHVESSAPGALAISQTMDYERVRLSKYARDAWSQVTRWCSRKWPGSKNREQYAFGNIDDRDI